MSATPQEVFDRLLAAFGPQHWWPGESPFEVIVGAVLVQNTAWKNVARALENLREAGLFSPPAIAATDQAELEALIRPAGYFRVKARRLRNLVDFICQRYDGSLDAMFAAPLASVREQLLGVHGIGPETADSILLYAGAYPTFVVDAYAARVLKRHGWIEPEADYYAIKEYFESRLPADAPLLNEYHALLVRVGRHHCRKTPDCRSCPLADLLPASGIVEM